MLHFFIQTNNNNILKIVANEEFLQERDTIRYSTGCSSLSLEILRS